MRLCVQCVTLALVLSCGPHANEVHTNGLARDEDFSKAKTDFEAKEERSLRTLAAVDERIAVRMGLSLDEATDKGTLATLLDDDPTLGVKDGHVDVFSFDARTKVLDAMRLPKAHPPPGIIFIEDELFERFVALERARVGFERGLPSSASALVRAIVGTWHPVSGETLIARDGWLERRLNEIAQSIKPSSLSRYERDELDDALDPLERLTTVYPKANGALARLRVVVSQTAVTSKSAIDVHAQLPMIGVKITIETLRTVLATIETDLRKQAGAPGSEDVVSQIDRIIGATPAVCTKATSASRLLQLAPPPERAYACDLVPAVAKAITEPTGQAAIVAVHTNIVVAMWAISAMTTGGLDATPMPRPLANVPPDKASRLERFAIVRPLEAIGRGLAAEWLVRYGMPAAQKRAARLLAYGDAPLDIVERELR